MSDTQVFQALRVLDEVVAEFGPGYTYDQEHPRYVDGKLFWRKPGCLVGQVLHRMGVPLRELAKNDKDYATVGGTMFSVDSVLLSHDARMVLDAAQKHQDSNYSWGGARDMAYDEARRRGYHVPPVS